MNPWEPIDPPQFQKIFGGNGPADPRKHHNPDGLTGQVREDRYFEPLASRRFFSTIARYGQFGGATLITGSIITRWVLATHRHLVGLSAGQYRLGRTPRRKIMNESPAQTIRTRDEVAEIYRRGLLDLVHEAATVHLPPGGDAEPEATGEGGDRTWSRSLEPWFGNNRTFHGW